MGALPFHYLFSHAVFLSAVGLFTIILVANFLHPVFQTLIEPLSTMHAQEPYLSWAPTSRSESVSLLQPRLSMLTDPDRGFQYTLFHSCVR